MIAKIGMAKGGFMFLEADFFRVMNPGQHYVMAEIEKLPDPEEFRIKRWYSDPEGPRDIGFNSPGEYPPFALMEIMLNGAMVDGRIKEGPGWKDFNILQAVTIPQAPDLESQKIIEVYFNMPAYLMNDSGDTVEHIPPVAISHR